MEKQDWRITDEAVIKALRKHGFEVVHPTPEYKPGVVYFITKTADADKDWYVTDCPIEFNCEYALPDGSILKSEGTSLILVPPEREEKP